MTSIKTGDLIIVTGPAAVGKSTLAKAIATEYISRGELCLAVELDVFARALPREWIAIGGRAGRYAERGFVYSRAANGSIELALGADARRVLAAFHRSVAAIVRSGVDVVCETIVYDDADWNDWAAALAGIAPCWVRLSAPVAVLEKREVDRSPLLRGLAMGMAARRPIGRYAVEADTATESVNTIVERVIRALTA